MQVVRLDMKSELSSVHPYVRRYISLEYYVIIKDVVKTDVDFYLDEITNHYIFDVIMSFKNIKA